MKPKGKYVLLSAVFFLVLQSLSAQTLTVQVNGVQNTKGVIRISFFTTSQEFDREIPEFEKIIPKTGMRGGQLSVPFSDLPPGQYGVVVLDDENENGKMDYRWFKPTEGYGFSNLKPGKLRRPAFHEFQFEFMEEDKTILVYLLHW
ncbi:MAG: DUF2141 domain-containing protein [Saprospirales bacterium]|nr:DUF2141 domain-containing protein [Saprospirales bacterium]MBK8491544.1 DUF2141 domain-containing protein [Saprospirales bacterium]